MKNCTLLMAMGMALSLSSLNAFAACENPQYQECLARLSTHAELAKSSPSQATSKDFITKDRVFDFAPMNEDIGPETIGPTTFNRIYKDLLSNIERQGQFLSSEGIYQHTQMLNMLCEQSKTNPDVIDVLAKYEAQHSGSPSQNLGLMGGALAIAALIVVGLFSLSHRQKGTSSAGNVIALPTRKKSDDDQKQNAA
ncbi:MAG: hypothetical protein ACJ763_11510 [Bdellovibrionia bacterium]